MVRHSLNLNRPSAATCDSWIPPPGFPNWQRWHFLCQTWVLASLEEEKDSLLRFSLIISLPYMRIGRQFFMILPPPLLSPNRGAHVNELALPRRQLSWHQLIMVNRRNGGRVNGCQCQKRCCWGLGGGGGGILLLFLPLHWGKVAQKSLTLA